MIHNGFSDAGQRIHEAGLAYSRKRVKADRIRASVPDVATPWLRGTRLCWQIMIEEADAAGIKLVQLRPPAGDIGKQDRVRKPAVFHARCAAAHRCMSETKLQAQTIARVFGVTRETIVEWARVHRERGAGA